MSKLTEKLGKAYLKYKLRKLMLKRYEIIDNTAMDCGLELLRYMKPELVAIEHKINLILDELSKVDSETPKYRYPC